MAYKVVLKKRTLENLWEAMDWYKKQSPGLEVKLQDESYNELEKLKKNPQRFSIVHNPFRRVLMKKFPYKIVCAIDEKRKKVLVAALWHEKRNPSILKKWLDE